MARGIKYFKYIGQTVSLLDDFYQKVVYISIFHNFAKTENYKQDIDQIPYENIKQDENQNDHMYMIFNPCMVLRKHLPKKLVHNSLHFTIQQLLIAKNKNSENKKNLQIIVKCATPRAIVVYLYDKLSSGNILGLPRELRMLDQQDI